KCARAHVLSFGPKVSAPTTGSAPAPTSGETAGTVTSFVAPTLTITLNDKKTEVTGKVTESTRVECESPAPTVPGGDDEGEDGGGEGDSGSGDTGSGSGDSSVSAGAHDSAMASAADTQGDQGDQGQGDDQ